jgi:hypothetical protein
MADLSMINAADFHPAMSKALVSFEPVWLDDAKGRTRNPQISGATGEKITGEVPSSFAVISRRLRAFSREGGAIGDRRPGDAARLGAEHLAAVSGAFFKKEADLKPPPDAA